MDKSNGSAPRVQEEMFELGENPASEEAQPAPDSSSSVDTAPTPADDVTGEAMSGRGAAETPDAEGAVAADAGNESAAVEEARVEETEASGLGGVEAREPEPEGSEVEEGPRMKRLVHSAGGSFKELEDGTRMELSEEEWRSELAHHFRRHSASAD